MQADEALPSLHGLLEQYTIGHDWLYKNFGIRPTVGWQIDAIGHSSATPALMALMGYEALVINRVHYRLKQQFKSEKRMEFFWKGAEVGQDASPLLTHILAEHYSTPEGKIIAIERVTWVTLGMLSKGMTSRAPGCGK